MKGSGRGRVWGEGDIQSVILSKKRKSVEREGSRVKSGRYGGPGRAGSNIRFIEDREQAQECVSSTEVYKGYLRPTCCSSFCTRAPQASIQY